MQSPAKTGILGRFCDPYSYPMPENVTGRVGGTIPYHLVEDSRHCPPLRISEGE